MRIDLALLAERLEDDEQTVEEWLAFEGFVEQDDGWLCDATALARLDRDEVISAVRAD